MKHLLHEPFVHFVILGGLLFAGHSAWQNHVSTSERTIVVEPAEMKRQTQIFASENMRTPSEADIEGLLVAYIEEEALVREAKRLGLDKDDAIVRRRLAEKMRFMIEDIGEAELPPREDLKAWFENNSERFMRPETRSFEHIFLNPRGRASTVIAEGQALLKYLQDNPALAADWESKSDPFVKGLNFTSWAQPTVQKDFGRTFANDVFALPNTGDWQGPLNSTFGVHLVRITDIQPPYVPELGTIQAEVEAVWLEDARVAENEKALKELYGQYSVEVVGQ